MVMKPFPPGSGDAAREPGAVHAGVSLAERMDKLRTYPWSSLRGYVGLAA